MYVGSRLQDRYQTCATCFQAAAFRTSPTRAHASMTWVSGAYSSMSGCVRSSCSGKGIAWSSREVNKQITRKSAVSSVKAALARDKCGQRGVLLPIRPSSRHPACMIRAVKPLFRDGIVKALLLTYFKQLAVHQGMKCGLRKY